MRHPRLKQWTFLLLLTVFAILIQGYHPGAEDDGVYLAAIHQDLNPHLFPHDSDFFRLQLQATIFDKLIAASVRATHLSVAWTALIWQFLSILLILWGCLRIACLCFDQPYAQWAGVALVASLLALPVTNTGLYLVDENLHPRALATAAILAAVVAVLERRWILTCLLLAIACAIHPIMGALGVSCCIFLGYNRTATTENPLRAAAMFVPLGWIFEPVSPSWKQAVATRSFYLLSRWTWYERLGAFAPLILLWSFSLIGKRSNSPYLQKISSRLVWYGLFQFAVALCIMLPKSLMRLLPLQPMRFLHLIYIFMVLLGGGLIGQRILGRHVYRWIILFLPLSAAMFYAQSRLYPGSQHLELPGRASHNPYLQAFAWIRHNTPQDAYFAINPYYLNLPGEDVHGFRALAERGVMADAVKDTAVVTQVPRLGPVWQKQTQAEAGYQHFDKSDFERLHREFGVDWALIGQPGVPGLDCPYQNSAVQVCKVP